MNGRGGRDGRNPGGRGGPRGKRGAGGKPGGYAGDPGREGRGGPGGNAKAPKGGGKAAGQGGPAWGGASKPGVPGGRPASGVGGKPGGYGGGADRGGKPKVDGPRSKAPWDAAGRTGGKEQGGGAQGYGKSRPAGNGERAGKPAGSWGGSQSPRPGAARHAGHRPGGKASGGYGQAPSIKPSKAALGQLLAQYGVPLRAPTLDQLWAYHQLLREHNHDQDLTRLIGFDTIAQRHYADCMILHGMMQGRWPSPLVDVGSGAGFPGMMIKLMSPATRIVLAEPRPRRVQFLEMVIRELGLSDISVFGHKVTSRSLTQPFAGAITRAFETVEKTLPRFGGCLGVGGKAIFMKGPKAVEEVAAFRSDEYRIVRNQAYRIPNTQQDRVLLILERTRVPAPGAARYEEAQEADVLPADPEDG